MIVRWNVASAFAMASMLNGSACPGKRGREELLVGAVGPEAGEQRLLLTGEAELHRVVPEHGDERLLLVVPGRKGWPS